MNFRSEKLDITVHYMNNGISTQTFSGTVVKTGLHISDKKIKLGTFRNHWYKTLFKKVKI